MNPQEFHDWLVTFSLAERAKALNVIAWSLTIAGRDFGLATDPSDGIRKLLGINELHHQLSQQTRHYLDGDESKCYPLDVFSRIVFEKADYYGIAKSLTWAIHSAIEKQPSKSRN